MPTLPSTLYERYTTSRSGSDPESTLQNGLSLLAEQPVDIFIETNDDASMLEWLVQALFQGDDDTITAPNKKSSQYEWWMGAKLIHKILPALSPTEIHSIANESIVFSEQSTTHHVVCLLLATFSLHKYSVQKRWKRWQSMVCETIRNFQNHRLDTTKVWLFLWMHHLVPSCIHVMTQLPEDALQISIVSALIGTTGELATEHTELSEELLETARTILKASQHDETWMWRHPWRIHALHNSKHQQFEDEDEEFYQRKNDIAWWASLDDPHERVADMSTFWDELGIAILAMQAFENDDDDRPQVVLSPAHTWTIWFPHVATLFQSPKVNLAMQFLERFLTTIPEESISSFSIPDSPLTTFQLLANQMVVVRRPHTMTDRIVTLMKSLLGRYVPKLQIEIVSQLVQDCPHPGLRAKFLDFLRPLILTTSEIWDLVDSLLQDLFQTHLSSTGLVNVEELIDNVEVYIGVITMIQVYALRNHKFRRQGWKEKIKSLLQSLEIAHGTQDLDNSFRLNLLQLSLEQVLSMVDKEK